MSTMALELPNCLVDIDRDEMEYVDGDFNVSVNWYGVNISFSGYETQMIIKAVNVGAGVATVTAALSAMGG